MIKKIILFFLVFGLFFGNIINAGGRINDINFIDDRNLINIKYNDKEINIGNILVKYNIGYKNEVNRNNIFFPIKIDFSEKIDGNLEIYIKKTNSYKNTFEKEKLYKNIQIKNSKVLNTYFYGTDYYEDSGDLLFYLNVNNKKIFLTSVGNNYSNELFILDHGIKKINSFTLNEITDLFLLKQFKKVNLEKENLSKKELKILNNYIFGGGEVIVEKIIFEKYFEKNNKIKKLNYPKEDCNYRNTCDKSYYELGFGNIFIMNNFEDTYGNKNIFLEKNEIKSILIDDVIESKFVPFYIILIFVIIYFLSLLVFNFLIPLKYKGNNFLFFYSIPAVSIFSLVSIIIISFVYRGFDDIENKVQINLHLNNKILKQVYIANFSVFGGDYKINIAKEHYLQNDVDNYRYNRKYSKKEIKYYNNKISEQLLGLNSLSILYYNYSQLVDEKIEDKNSLGTKNLFKSKQDLLYNYSKKEDKIKGYTTSYNGNIIFSREIDKIITRNIETDFMKKYSYGGIKNKNIVIDVYYK